MVFLRISEWMRATPLTACEPAMHRWAMLMRFTAPSSTSDMRRSRSTSPGNAAATRCSGEHRAQAQTWNPGSQPGTPRAPPIALRASSPAQPPFPMPPLRSAPTGLQASSAHIQEALVDLIDDLEVAGQQRLNEMHGPALQGLRQHSVVGVGAGPDRHVPGLMDRTGESGTPRPNHHGSPHTACSRKPGF